MSLDFDPSVDYYKALGVTPKATADEIKKAYRKLAKSSHPDSTGGDKRKEARFKEVSAAYDVLGDARRRAQYDEVRSLGGGRVRPGPGGFPGAGTGGGGFGGGNQVWDLGDLFSTMFSSGGGPAGAASKGGGRRGVRFEHEQAEARGPAAETKVAASDGSSLALRGSDVHSDVRIAFDRAILGTVAEVPTVAGTASVKIPPGTSSGRKLRLRGKGVAVDHRGPGDHYVTVHVDVPGELDDEGQRLLHQLRAHLARSSGETKRK